MKDEEIINTATTNMHNNEVEGSLNDSSQFCANPRDLRSNCHCESSNQSGLISYQSTLAPGIAPSTSYDRETMNTQKRDSLSERKSLFGLQDEI